MGKPAVVGIADLTVDVAGAAVRAGGRSVPEGARIAIDGTGGVVVVGSPRIVTPAAGPHLHRLLGWADEVSGGPPDRPEAERLGAAQAVLGHR
jgi:pyruvate, orthophosphate dikinase